MLGVVIVIEVLVWFSYAEVSKFFSKSSKIYNLLDIVDLCEKGTRL